MLWSRFARRYMLSPKSHSVINIIAFVSVVAVAVPTAAMIILLAMFAGLTNTVEELTSATGADIEVVARRGGTFATETFDYEAITRIEGVEHLSAYLEQSVIAASAGRRVPLTLRGVDDGYFEVVPVEQYVSRGYEGAIASGDMLLGASLASSLAAYGLGTEIELYALNRRQLSSLLPMGGVSRMATRLGCVVNANAEINGTMAIAELGRVQRLLNYEGRITAVVVDVATDADVEAVERAIERVVGEAFDVVTRHEHNAAMNAILRMEKLAIVLIGMLIALVATFAIVGTVIMLITEKQRDITTLRALGAGRRLIRNIFVGEGVLLTLTGVFVGTILGVGLSLGQQYFGWVRIPGGGVLEYYPVELNVYDVAIVVMVVMAMGWAVSRLTVGAKLKRGSIN